MPNESQFRLFDPVRTERAKILTEKITSQISDYDPKKIQRIEDQLFVDYAMRDYLELVTAKIQTAPSPEPFTISYREVAEGPFTLLFQEMVVDKKIGIRGVALNIEINEEQFALTLQQATIAACLLGSESSNKSIALRLGKTVNNVRHYFKTISLKFGQTDEQERMRIRIALTSLSSGLLTYVK